MFRFPRAAPLHEGKGITTARLLEAAPQGRTMPKESFTRAMTYSSPTQASGERPAIPDDKVLVASVGAF